MTQTSILDLYCLRWAEFGGRAHGLRLLRPRILVEQNDNAIVIALVEDSIGTHGAMTGGNTPVAADGHLHAGPPPEEQFAARTLAARDSNMPNRTPPGTRIPPPNSLAHR
ncbi:hypothetical protein NSK11_contig00041-0040 [Nocardia seriolae]|uniref:Uncharacterized protein n=1 Tax=Nocardia seriolae TaxID=37332 RepID=A0ABC9YT93_9NOCA|nr:hypothetical protein NSERKGN1266_40090 [Nocardia seriolae]BEK96004.1 hypothetical protein NSER024013_39100 [Nocardia seriolae]GAM46808.1 hypothetical protein NS07_v2contig00038-0019 [Nocardia seriolae]GAP28729.1 hypothetical protein NSK11_contig00041-0040 [Nocardia seriolae]GEM26246.1 hypothetical protein NS2_44850 [Nocardia seriolae NBRC 15557]